jgi:hypothetical protein
LHMRKIKRAWNALYLHDALYLPVNPAPAAKTAP